MLIFCGRDLYVEEGLDNDSDPEPSDMELSSITAISPLDGRYCNKVKDLACYLTEYGLICYRTLVEGLIHEVFTMVLRGLSGTKPSRPGKFRRCLDGYAVKSSLKAEDGVISLLIDDAHTSEKTRNPGLKAQWSFFISNVPLGL
ncbi:hypothetical protein L2E82_16777 [Cichorium intybus]|uniref:Uncharacterized protein n=1 Tax=Cichorium intybus TaxID=13427 RepID=A0ACB9F7T3_CICIN|nr:hypothetical protein L2E82_16777 [Cichorium intybus]